MKPSCVCQMKAGLKNPFYASTCILFPYIFHFFFPGASYFFKGKEYWRVAGSDMEVEAGYPRPIGKDWLVCTEMQSDSPEMQNNSNTRLHGQHQADHAENGYEVCSCTSDSASPLGTRLTLSPAWVLAPLWTLTLALSSAPL